MTNPYFGVCLYQPKDLKNWGVVLRSAHAFGASFIGTIGSRYRRQPSDCCNATRHIPTFHFLSIEDFLLAKPKRCQCVLLEVGGNQILSKFEHPRQAVYVFGGEDRTLNPLLFGPDSQVITIPTRFCLNLAVAASICMWDRISKLGSPL